MILNFKCETDEFLKFRDGMYTSILIVGTKKPYEHAYKVDLGDIVAVSNCVSDESLAYRVSHISKYSGASTPESAMNDLRARLGLPANSQYCPIYLADDINTGKVPFLHEGIYALIIERYKGRISAKGGKNQGKNPRHAKR